MGKAFDCVKMKKKLIAMKTKAVQIIATLVGKSNFFKYAEIIFSRFYIDLFLVILQFIDFIEKIALAIAWFESRWLNRIIYHYHSQAFIPI